jgi:hypothetical protein
MIEAFGTGGRAAHANGETSLRAQRTFDAPPPVRRRVRKYIRPGAQGI